ncbi:uncharacterized protein LOC143026535 [Oratosquilla oratoria]|uniref:uncharacterized protein LOC143026535 n=1 Tax=Oratosquilla oratoria TaxID=337810 RepID=UPI003F767E05
MADLEYGVTKPEDVDELNQFLAESFFPREPMTMGLEMTWEDHRKWVTDSMGVWASCAASFLVRDKSKGNRIVGVRLSKFAGRDSGLTFEEGLKTATGKTKIFLNILCEMESAINVFEDESIDKALDFVILCVHKDYVGKGIATKLVEMAEKRGKELGAQIVGVQATNCISQNLFKKMGYTVRKTVVYGTYEFEGKRVFNTSLQGKTTCLQILTKPL